MAEDIHLMKLQVNRSGLLSSEIGKLKLKIKMRKQKNKKKQIKRTQDILKFTVVKVMVERVVNVLLLLNMVIVALGQN